MIEEKVPSWELFWKGKRMVQLVIAEKPSVAASLAKVLGVGKKKMAFGKEKMN